MILFKAVTVSFFFWLETQKKILYICKIKMRFNTDRYSVEKCVYELVVW